MNYSSDQLLEAARAAAEKAYAPYSHFPVGAAVLTDTDTVYTGCNIENASYGLTVCAERTAIFNAVLAGTKRIAKLVVTVSKGSGKTESLMPCGACRQVMAEFMDPDAEILVDGVGTFLLKDILPTPFKLS